MDIMLAQSKAGHDKNQVYVILERDDTYSLLANGETKPIEKPKKKKNIHIQIIKNLPEEVMSVVNEYDELSNLSIKRILKCFNRRNTNV